MNRLQCQVFYEELSQLLAPFKRVALLNTEHETIFLKYQNVADIGTLSQSAVVSHSYLQLQDGDIVLTNDPYSGGTLLSSPTLILGIGTRTQKGVTPAEFLVAYRLTHPPRVGYFKTIDEEGLRIPPSPYFMRGEINRPIVEALKNHPLLAEGFTERITAEAQLLLQLRSLIKTKLASGRFEMTKQKIKSYLQATSREFERRMENLAEGSKTIELNLTDTETVRLKLDHLDGHFHFDFSGSSSGEKLFLTDSAVIGTVIGATLSLLNQNIPVNSGIFSRFDVKAPRGSFLNAVFPRSLFLGHTDGTYLLANVVVRCLAMISKKHGGAISGATSCQYQIKFNDQRVFSDSLQPGAGGTHSQSGQNGIQIWSHDEKLNSIEALERNYPLQVLGTGFRAESGGEGRYKGGQGMVRRLKILEDAELSWTYAASNHNPEGAEGGKSALGTEMVILKANKTKIELPSSGTHALKKGDVLTILSPGGGGFGVSAG